MSPGAAQAEDTNQRLVSATPTTRRAKSASDACKVGRLSCVGKRVRLRASCVKHQEKGAHLSVALVRQNRAINHHAGGRLRVDCALRLRERKHVAARAFSVLRALRIARRRTARAWSPRVASAARGRQARPVDGEEQESCILGAPVRPPASTQCVRIACTRYRLKID